MAAEISNKEIFYNNSYPSVTVQHLEDSNTEGHLCVFGILSSERGTLIARQMLEWLKKEYDVWTVTQELPGSLFEYPAIRVMQWLLTEYESTKTSCLYLHTKGAALNKQHQGNVRKMWKQQFTTNKEKYFIESEQPVVRTPYIGPNNETWFNGFVANKAAISLIDLKKPNSNRHIYQKLWKNYKNIVKPVVTNRIIPPNEIHLIFENYSEMMSPTISAPAMSSNAVYKSRTVKGSSYSNYW